MQSDEELLEILWNFLCFATPLEKADVIIGGGCRDLGVAKHCSELYRQGLSPTILFTGYQQPGMAETEAAAFSKIACSLGVPKEAIIGEPLASNTGQNITYSQALLKALNVSPKRVILVHKPYMSRRFLATAEAQWSAPQPHFYVSHEQIKMKEYMDREGKERTIAKMLGDFNRIVSYPEKGFQSEQPISSEIIQVTQELESRGYQPR